MVTTKVDRFNEFFLSGFRSSFLQEKKRERKGETFTCLVRL